MNASEILAAVNAGEDKDWEFKSAKGGMPGSLWETYSAMANTDGGVIVLGVKENDGDFEVQGLDDPAKMEKDFWTTINNRGKVNANLLGNHDTRIVPVHSKPVLVVQVPRANRRQRPIFVGQNPLEGTYRRYGDGDYLCSREEVGRMLADQADQPADCEILTGFKIEDLDKRSLEQYRNRFASRSPAHPWLKSDAKGLLEKLGGWRIDRTSGQEGLTVAGLLMFGKDEAIRDPAAVPQYHVDYRERLSPDPQVRWTDRIWPDGTWVANLFQFFERVYPRLVVELKIPFQFATLRRGETTTTPPPDLFQRHDDTIVHEAIREAFVNALIHADFRGAGGIIIERFRDRLEFSNPGTLLLGIEQVLKGGVSVSECRNKTLQGMFATLGYGEKAGSGIDKIRQGWASQKWRWPMIQEQHRPDRVRLVLPMVSLLPEESLARLRAVLGDSIARLNGLEVQALVTADMEGSVTNLRLQQFCTDHTTDITRMLQGLVAKGLLVKDGYGRWASYLLSERLAGSRYNEEGTPDITPEDSQHNETSSQHNETSSQHNETSSQRSDPVLGEPGLLALAAPARQKARINPELMREIIRNLCSGRFLTFTQIGSLVNRHPEGIRNRFLSEMVKSGELVPRFPESPTHSEQAYQTNPDWKAK
jgi:ATP-dependent DNA helicase RecG